MSELFVDWYLVRHAPVAGAKEGIYRSLDGAADLSNEAALRFASRCLPAQGQWWVSPMLRTRQTAAALAAEIGADGHGLATDERLREQSFGAWHGLTFGELWEKIRDLPPHNWSYLAPESAPPGGENYEALWARVEDFVAEHTQAARPEPRVLVTHAGVIRAVVGQALGLPTTRALAVSLATLSVTKLTQRIATDREDASRRGGDWQLVYLNRAP